jgi:hypothetical protein
MCQRNHAFTYVCLFSYIYAIFLPLLSLLPTYMQNMLILPTCIQSMLILLVVTNSSECCHYTLRRRRSGLWTFVLLTHVLRAAPFLSVFATMTSFILSMCVGNSNVYYLFHYITCKSISTNKQMVYISVMFLCFLIKIGFLAWRTDIGVGGMVTT